MNPDTGRNNLSGLRGQCPGAIFGWEARLCILSLSRIVDPGLIEKWDSFVEGNADIADGDGDDRVVVELYSPNAVIGSLAAASSELEGLREG
ncbi:hypothetical protein MA16_Dca007442 [Dendrobium catenatum]|uniref:Uncharacterized protein n=1 Tax=Dendrobium catenatum TaxID=906689 RepID=A0A2I0WAP7_9ASPA|nr:hypothetical protein MA16_Dca007442 [Dendrobium catenatum]